MEPPLWEQQANLREVEGERLQKLLASRGYGSRRQCEEMIEEGRVLVNGTIAVLGRRVLVGHDEITIDGRLLVDQSPLVYYLLDKPLGILSSAKDDRGRPVVVGLVPPEPRVFPVGRLDADTEGLLLLTNDGHITHRITHPSYGLDKEYLVTVDGQPSAAAIAAMRAGIELDDGVTSPADIAVVGPSVLRITIHEGRNRQVRRMCEAIGHRVMALRRVRIGPIDDRDMRPGQWRTLRDAELVALRRAVGLDP